MEYVDKYCDHLIVGIILSPHAMNLIDDSIISISGELRRIALVIILTRAGLSLDISDLKKVGRPAVLMCFVPACVEMIGTVLLAPKLLGVSLLESAIIGSVIAAVALIVVALAFRMIGVGISLVNTNLSKKERLFCMMAYTPKATVQATIGAICVDNSYKKLLRRG